MSYFPGTDRLAEIFLGNGRAGSDIDAAAKDFAVVASIALQHGVPVDVIRKALLRSQGKASRPLGAALDAIAEQEGGDERNQRSVESSAPLSVREQRKR